MLFISQLPCLCLNTRQEGHYACSTVILTEGAENASEPFYVEANYQRQSQLKRFVQCLMGVKFKGFLVTQAKREFTKRSKLKTINRFSTGSIDHAPFLSLANNSERFVR